MLGPASAPSDRRRRDRYRHARAAATRGLCRTRARGPDRRPRMPPGARTARRDGPASARFPSHRTARTRPTLASLRVSLARIIKGRWPLSSAGADEFPTPVPLGLHDQQLSARCRGRGRATSPTTPTRGPRTAYALGKSAGGRCLRKSATRSRASSAHRPARSACTRT